MAKNDRQNETGTAVATAEPRRGVPAIRSVLEKASSRITDVLPKHLTPERMIQVAMVQCYRTPKLAECDPNTILAAVIRSSSLGLDLEPSMCEAYLIPRWNSKARANECQFQIGYQGLRKLALQSGKIAYIRSMLVHERDEFSYYFNPAPVFIHRPYQGNDKGPIVSVYSHVRLHAGEDLIEVMTTEEVNRIMARSQAAITGKDGYKPQTPWDTDWGEMARKTVLRRHSKSLPRSTNLDQALQADEAMYEGIEPTMIPAHLARGPLGRPRVRGLAALNQAQISAPSPEPEFTPGVERPIYTEADDIDPAAREMEDDDPAEFPGDQP